MNRIALMSLTFATLLATLAIGQKTQEECLGEFEFWGCQSSTRECQRFCENKGIDHKKQVCKLDCQKACVCEAGYLRNGPDGECVYDTECPKVEVSSKKKPKAKTIKAESKKTQVKPKVKKSPPAFEEEEVIADYEEDEL